jgi:Na+-translocating ferredoxin:NAD+ oxidoreductase RnfG subunit
MSIGRNLSLIPLATLSVVAHATEYLTTEQAQKILFSSADTFKSTPLKLSDEQKDQIKDLSGVRQRQSEVQVWRAEQKGKLLGWYIVDEVVGKHEFITYAAAISPEGKVLGLEILNYRETHGGQVRDSAWRKQFVGKTLQDPFKLDKDVANISGATLSCRNVLDGVKRLLAIQKVTQLK